MMGMKSRNLFSIGSLALMAIVFVGLVILSEFLFKGFRLDLTGNGQYTLNEGTKNILADLEEPVSIYYFFSEDASRDLPQIRSYARWVGELLEDMADRSDGQLTIRRIDPKPFSPEEDQAAKFGLQAIPVGTGMDSLYFGLAGTNALDDVQIMPFLQPSKEQFLEYDLAKMVSSLSHLEQMKVGLLSSLNMQPGFDPASGQTKPAWTIYDQLDQLFELQVIASSTTVLPDDIDLLFLVHPKELSDEMRYALDQFVLRGGRLVAFIDPFAESDLGDKPNDPMARLNAGSSSTLGPLLDAWGVGFDTTRVVGDLLYALQVSAGSGVPPVRHIGIMSVNRDGLNGMDIVSADLETVNFSSAGWLEPLEGATTQLRALVETSENAASLQASRLRFLANPQDLMSGFTPTGDRYILAARITGPAPSAFESVPEGKAAEQHVSESVEAGINVILFADTDILTDRMWVQRQQFLGQVLVNSFADNGTLVVNSVDNLLGSSDLISIRTRASSSRPFDRVERLRLKAESQYRATEESLNRELQETERKLTEMQSLRNDGDLTVLSDEQQAELQRFMDQRIQIRSDLRQVRHDLDRDIDALGSRLKLINIGLMPLIVVFMALLFSHQRRKHSEGSSR